MRPNLASVTDSRAPQLCIPWLHVPVALLDAMSTWFGAIKGWFTTEEPVEVKTEAPPPAQPPETLAAVTPAPTALPTRASSPPTGLPPSKKARVETTTTDLSDRHIQLCAQDAILAVQNRVIGCVCTPGKRARAHPSLAHH